MPKERTCPISAKSVRLSNWGRWGAEDEKGTTNLITEECVAAAARTVKQGKVFDLGLPLDEDGPQLGGGGAQPGQADDCNRQGRDTPARRRYRSRRLGHHAAAGGDPLGRPGPLVLRRQDLQRLSVDLR